MKRTLSLLTVLLLSNLVLAQTTAIPDPNFEQALIDLGYDTGAPDGVVTTANINTVDSLDVSSKSISDLTGIEDFTALTYLDCGAIDLSYPLNSLTNLNVSNNTALTYLKCNYNSLTTLDVSNNTALTYLDCSINSLTTLDVSNNTALTVLECDYNSLTTLDVLNNTNLTILDCSINSLTSLDVSNNTALTVLGCANNSLTTLDVSNNTALTVLGCANNSLTTLDVSNNIALYNLSCSGNFLSTLDASNNTDLVYLWCYSNSLTTLDVSNTIALEYLHCYNNSLTTIDVSNNVALKVLTCYNNSLTRLDIRNGNNSNLLELKTKNNPNLFCITVDDPSYSVVNWPCCFDYDKDDWTQYSDGICGTNKISGIAYLDEDKSCTQDNGESGISHVVIKAAGPTNSYTSTNDTGYYELWVDSNESYQMTVVSGTNFNLLNGYCPVGGYSINSGTGGTTITGVDFGLDFKSCALLSVDISMVRLRRCFTNIASITYQNEGTVLQTNAEIFVDFPEYVKLISASESYSVVNSSESIYKFTIDTIRAFSKGNIYFVDSVICGNEDIRGYTQCIKTWITPKSSCAETKDTTSWDKSSIKVMTNAQCIGDSIAQFIIINHGSGDMLAAHEYRFYYDNQLSYTGSFQLNSNDSLVIDVTADGSTIRLEADQHPLHPGNSRPRTSIEGCGSATPATASLGFWKESSNDDLDYDVSENCLEISDSYDPNDKQVNPQGITGNHYVSESDPVKYTIQFQNTGTATAYKIIIVDTLSNLLDLATLNINGASHNFEYEVLGEDVVILAFTFNDINLPDSTTDEPNSHGFVSFTISPIDSIAPGTQIENSGNIYFDFNSAIRTNTVTVIALDTTIISGKTIVVTEGSTPYIVCNTEASFTQTGTSICPGEFLNFTNTSTGATSYIWKEDGITFSTAQDSSRIFNSSGTFTIRLIANKGNCSDSSEIAITVNPAFSIDKKVSICSGSTYIFPDNTTSAVSVVDTSSLTSSTGCDSIIITTLTVDSTYNISKSVSICVGSTYIFPDSSTSTVSKLHTSSFTSTTGCDSIIITALTVDSVYNINESASICAGSTYIFPDGTTSTVSKVYTSSLISSTGCDSIIITTLTIDSVYNISESVSICTGSVYIFPDSTTSTVSKVYTSSFTSTTGCDSIIITTLTIDSVFNISESASICAGSVYIFPDSTTSTVSKVYTSSFTSTTGCDSIIITTLTIDSVFNISESASICAGSTYIFPDNTTSTIPIVHTSSFVRTTGCDSIIITTLTIDSVNTAVTISGTTLTANGSGSYQWIDCDNADTPISGETNQSFTATTSGNYAVEITQNGCLDTSACNTITGVGIMENDFGSSLTAYPNPTTGSFTVELGQNYEKVTVTLKNSVGQIVSIQNYTSTNQLNLEIVGSIGVYLVDIRTEQGKKLLLKVLKE